MCGICGKLIFDKDARVSSRLLKSMADSISHRGPDDEGFYVSGQVGLGFRRLSIIDLSGGHQPLSNEDGTVWIVFNGEIYNYQELRTWLLTKGHTFKTQSDTEVIVHLYEEMGESCVNKLRGMFAFAIWNVTKRTLLLARDRIGIKPLYYYLGRNSLLFASELKAILVDSTVERALVPAMIDRTLTFNYLPGEETLLQDIHKLAPGSYMLVEDGKATIRHYWDLSFEESSLTLSQAEQRLADLLEESMKLHMISDVPVGFLLSGGVDSTAMLGLAGGKTEQALSSFTIGFADPGIIDERPYARLAAAKYGTDHHELTITSKDFEDFLPQYIRSMEEPVCEPPAVALYFISRLAREYVKVLISGEGGDEAFAGYQVYRNMLWLERLKRLLGPVTGVLSKSLLYANLALKSRRVARYAPLLTMPLESNYLSGTTNRMAFFNEYPDRAYTKEFSQFVNKGHSFDAATQYWQRGVTDDIVNKMLYVDTKTWLPHDLLLKADKMTMANSIELRVPFLDHKLLEFAASLPGNYKVRGLTTKFIAKKVLREKVPQQILKRRKAGFPVPFSNWLRNDLRAWLCDILRDRETLSRGYFKTEGIDYLLSENVRHGTYTKELFTLAVLELWHREFLTPSKSLSQADSHVQAHSSVIGKVAHTV